MYSYSEYAAFKCIAMRGKSMSESTVMTADSYKNIEQAENVVDSPDKSKDEDLETEKTDLQGDDSQSSEGEDVSETNGEEGETEVTQDSDNVESDAESQDDESEGTEGDEDKPEKPEIPKWAEKRFKKISERERRKYEREISGLKKQVQDIVDNVQQQPVQGFDPNTQVQNPFTGQIVARESVEGQVALQLTQAANLAEQAEKQQKINKAQQELKQKLEKGYDKFDDYEDVVKNAGVTQTMLEAAYLSENTDELLYNLAKYKPEEIERISKLSPERQFREMVLIESQMKQSTKKKVVKKIPEPPSKIKGSGASLKDESDLSYEDLIKRRRNAERKALGLSSI